MKRLVLVLLLALSGIAAKPQSGLVHIDTNYVWSIMSSGWSFSTSYYFFEGDTNLNGHQWKKLYECFQDSTLSNPVFHAAIREENGKVFLHQSWFTGDTLLYDHSLQAGDSIPYCMGFLKVDSVDQVVVDGQLKKRIHFETPWSFFNEQWIEGIGSTFGLPYAMVNYCVFDLGFNLLCAYKDGNLVYDNPEIDGCFISSIGIEEINNAVSFYPNPVTNISEMIIKGNTLDYKTLIISDVSGRILREVPVNGNRILIKKAGLQSGLYFYSLKGKGKSLSGRFIIQ